MQVLRGIWRFLVGVKDALVLLFMLLFFGLLYAALSMAPKPSQTGNHRIDVGALAVVEKSNALRFSDELHAMGQGGKGSGSATDLVIAGQPRGTHQQKRRQRIGLVVATDQLQLAYGIALLAELSSGER